MKEIVVISGKGGTGKTSMVALFATLAGDGTRATWKKDMRVTFETIGNGSRASSNCALACGAVLLMFCQPVLGRSADATVKGPSTAVSQVATRYGFASYKVHGKQITLRGESKTLGIRPGLVDLPSSWHIVWLTPSESVSVVIQGRHDEVRVICLNGKTIFRAPPHRQRPIGIPAVVRAVARHHRGLEDIAREFIVGQVCGDLAQPLPARTAALIRARMCGSSSPVITVTGSGNHGILLGVPFYELYRKYGTRILPAALFSLLAVIHMTDKRSRISADCGLATKAAPALAAGLAFAQGANIAQIRRVMSAVSETLHRMKCHGARATCGKKAERALRVVLTETKAVIAKEKALAYASENADTNGKTP